MRLVFLLCLLLGSVAQPGTAQEPEEGAGTVLFNGVDLQGWHGDPSYWTVEEGCLVGRSTAEHPLPRSIYLFSEAEAGDFELSFEYRIVGGNSGIQYRSQRLADGEVAGYQADIEDGDSYSGILYESAGRAIVANRGERLHFLADGTRIAGTPLGDTAALQQEVHKQQWNRYRVVAKGARLVHEINGVRMIDVLDQDAAHARNRGVFALQLHQGPPMEVRYRGLHLRHLAAEDNAGLEPFPLDPAPVTLAAGAPVTWIWGPDDPRDNETRWFFRTLELKQAATVSGGEASADNHFEARLDGIALGNGEDWSRPSAFLRGQELAAGSHLLAIAARNDGGPAGLAVRLELRLADGSKQVVVSDDGWHSTPVEPSGWAAGVPRDQPSAPWQGVRLLGAAGAPGVPWGQVMAPRIATPVDRFQLPPGFEASLIYSATADDGSWASMTFGDGNDIYVSPERGPLLRFRFPAGPDAAPVVDHLDTPVHSAQGLLYAKGSLYADVAGGLGEGGDGGLHRLRDQDGDGVFEEHRHLAKYGPPSEHGPHGIVLGPDGMLYVVIGNHTRLPEGIDPDSPLRHVQEDVLLPRLWDPRGHANGIYAPGAVVLRTDEDASHWDLVAGGMRNPYDLAFAPDGSLYTYDADMEWDIGTPWYRAPRVIEILPGGESGWRSGSAKWPAAYPDSLPPVVETGPASPVGISFATASNFPAPWKERLFLGDWAYGRIRAVALHPDGAGMRGKIFDFLAGKPLNVTDLEFGPDGDLWFVTGGRGTQSGLYRVRWVGGGATAVGSATDAERAAPTDNPSRAMRRALEQGQSSLADIFQALASQDRILRYAARVQLESRPVASWRERALASSSALLRGEAMLALARIDAANSAAIVREQLLQQDLATAPTELRWLLLRTAMLLRTRDVTLGAEASERTSPDPAIAVYWGAVFPTHDAALDREIARLLVAVEAPDLAPRLWQLLQDGSFQEEQLHAALLLRLVHSGWTPELRLQYFRWLREARGLPGGFSLAGFLDAIEADALAAIPAEERQALLAQLPPPASSMPAAPLAPRTFRQEWTVTDALAALPSTPPTTNHKAGQELFRAVGCIQCHRFGGEGGSLGPDLSAVGSRFGRRDLLEAILEPQKVVSDQFTLVPMPKGLMNTLDAQELDLLLRFLEAGPDAN